MGAQIVFLSLFLAITAGEHPVALQVNGPVRAVRILLDGRQVAILKGPPWQSAVDFGAAIVPHELAAVGLDERGNEVVRAVQVINLPRSTAELDIVLDRNAANVPIGARLNWRHVTNAQPARTKITLDGKPLVNDRVVAKLPKLNLDMPHVLAAEMRFEDGVAARRELVIENERSYSAGAELTPVLLRETSSRHPQTWAGCLTRADGSAVRTAAVEQPRALAVFVSDPDPRAIEQTLTPMLSAKVGRTDDQVKRMLQIDRDTIARIIWPVGKHFEYADEEKSQLFQPSVDVDLFAKGLPWLLMRSYGEDEVRDTPRRYTDAVAVAGISAITGAQRRAVVYVLSGKDDASHFRPAVVRRYLQSIGVPLFVWSLSGPRPDLAESWGEVDDISNIIKLGAALRRLREELAGQRIAWVEVDPLAALRLKANEKCGVATVAKP
jgi:hypothetical protein